MRCPPDLQSAAILSFLATALRQDSKIQQWTDASPDGIVAQVAEYQPLQRVDGKTYIARTQIPLLALHTVSSTRKREGARWGRIRTMWLWYLFQDFQARDGQHGLTVTDRWKGIIDWRIGYWLKVQKYPDVGANSTTPIFDLQEVGKIKLLEIGETTYFSEGDIEGIRIPLTVKHMYAPYEEMDPATFDLLDFSVWTHDGTYRKQLEVEADIDQT